MPRYGGNPSLKGNKNSGRKSCYEEHNKIQAINKLWEKINNKVQNEEELSDYEQKLVIALLPKTIKQTVEAENKFSISSVLDRISKDNLKQGS